MPDLANPLRVVTKDSKKPKQVRVYLNQENTTTLKELAERMPDLEESKILTLLVSACLRAAKENNYRFNMPLKISFSEGDDESGGRSTTPGPRRK